MAHKGPQLIKGLNWRLNSAVEMMHKSEVTSEV